MSKLDKQLVAEPELLILRQKMKSTANDTSVSNVSNESVKFMMEAMLVSNFLNFLFTTIITIYF